MKEVNQLVKSLWGNAKESLIDDLQTKSKNFKVSNITNGISAAIEIKNSLGKKTSVESETKSKEIVAISTPEENLIVRNNESSGEKMGDLSTINRIQINDEAEKNILEYYEIVYQKRSNGTLNESAKYFLLLKREQLKISLIKAKEIEFEIESIFTNK